MDWEAQAEAESRRPQRLATGGEPSQAARIKVGRRVVDVEHDGKHTELEVFTMTLDGETIQLLPLRNWGQLDVYKWRVRGKLPATPAGIEVVPDHIKITGQLVSTNDPDGCPKVEKLLNDWLALEQANLDLARRKAHAKPAAPAAAPALSPEEQPMRFHVEVDKRAQVHILCVQGKEVLAQIGLNAPGFSSLVSQGLMRKPRSLKVGALHDWVELDGAFFSFEKGNNESLKLEQALNQSYAPLETLGKGKEVVVFANAASPTGFDIQFPVSMAGAVDNRRRPLNEQTLDLLQDPVRCGLLHKELVIKLAPPNLIFKQRTPDGGERYLPRGPASSVRVLDEDGLATLIDLSQPVNYLRRNVAELTAVFNHPAINQHGKLSNGTAAAAGAQPSSFSSSPASNTVPAPQPAAAPPQPATPLPQDRAEALAAQPQQNPLPPPPSPKPVEPAADKAGGAPTPPAHEAGRLDTRADDLGGERSEGGLKLAPRPAEERKPLPNLWLGPLLRQEPAGHEWLAFLVYGKMAEWFGNSNESQFGLSACWAVALGETEDASDPQFKGVFLTAKGGLGFINQGHLARFQNGVVFLGTPESALEGIEVRLLAAGLDTEGRVTFVVTQGYRAKFGVPEPAVRRELERLKDYGVAVMSVREALESRVPIEVAWTVPLHQADPENLQAVETTRPADNEPAPALLVP